MRARAFVLLSVPLLFLAPPASGQAVPASDTTEQPAAPEGYLLAARLHAAPDAFSDEVPGVGRDERVRVVPVAGKAGWFAVYKVGSASPVGYALHPYVSRFSGSGVEEVQSAGGGVAEPEEAPGLPEVVFAEGDEGALAVVSAWANVREGPSASARAFGVIRPGVPFRVLAVERGWGRVRLEGEQGFGYVSGRLLSRAPAAEAPAAPAPAAPAPAAEAPAPAAEAPAPAPTPPAPAAAEAAPAPAEADLPPDQVIVYVTRTGRRYHRADCSHLRANPTALPLSEAAEDYTPCRVCRPPTP